MKKKLFMLATLLFCVCCLTGCTEELENLTNELDKKLDTGSYLKVEENTVKNTKDEYGYAYYIEGYIKNESDKNYSYVQVTYTTYDKDGNTLGTCLDNNSGLEANGRWKFKAMCLEEVSDIASYKLTDVTGY